MNESSFCWRDGCARSWVCQCTSCPDCATKRKSVREPEWMRRRRETGLPAKDMTVTA